MLNVSHLGFWESFSCLFSLWHTLLFCVWVHIWVSLFYDIIGIIRCSRLLNIFRPSSRIRQFSRISDFVIYKDLLKLENGISTKIWHYICLLLLGVISCKTLSRSADRAKKDVCILTHVYIYIYQWTFLHVKPFLTILS